MRSPAAGNASPRKSLSTPAMIRSSEDFPAPLAPSTPILAPWKNESQMPRRISRLGGTTVRRALMTTAYSPAIPEPLVLVHHAAVLHDADPSPRQTLPHDPVPAPPPEPH